MAFGQEGVTSAPVQVQDRVPPPVLHLPVHVQDHAHVPDPVPPAPAPVPLIQQFATVASLATRSCGENTCMVVDCG